MELVYTTVLEAVAARIKSSSLFLGTRLNRDVFNRKRNWLGVSYWNLFEHNSIIKVSYSWLNANNIYPPFQSRYGRVDKGIFLEEKLPELDSGVMEQKVKDVWFWRRQENTINFHNKNIKETFLKHFQATWVLRGV